MSMIVIAPFSNDDIRDWPATHFATLADRLAARDPRVTIRIVGSPGQRLRACEIVRFLDPARVVNDCGRAGWAEVVGAVKAAACVIGNNSGIAHLSARIGVPTVCIFGGSHQRREWRPLGNAIVVSRAIGCAPCHLHLATSCPFDKACLREIAPDEVIEAMDTILARSGARAPERDVDMQHGVRAC